jgi:glycosyltransferase involved in cell wall biosynthesis
MKGFYPLVSCIIPVYNAEKYLDQGITSLLNQTYKNLEIILVDDQSTDNSWAMCKDYAEKYPNILIFQNKKNSGGPLRGRERGIQEARGEWITSMDCDDYVGSNYVEHLVDATHEGSYDIAVTGYSKLHEDGSKEDFLWENYSQTTAERLRAFYQHFLANNFWTDPSDTSGQNLIRATICKSTDLSKYSSSIYAEDTLMALAFIANSKNGVNFVDHHDFVWRQVPGSGSHGGFSDRANKTEFFKACYDIFHTPSIYSLINKQCPLVTVIIPVYNVEKYLSECLDSIISQTYENLEIIVVNDGATDGSQAIIDEYKKKDLRIVSLKQKNQGLNMARAKGSAVITGEYVAFVDSDDIVHEDYIRVMYENLIENSVDISISGLKNFAQKSEIKKFEDPVLIHSEQVIKDRRDVLNYYLGEIPSISNVHQMTAWGKLYKAGIIRATDWAFSNYRRHEDNLESLQWYSMAENGIAVQSVPLYYYRKNPNSITQTLQQNIGPDGQKLNYFEFINEVYEKIKTFIDDESMNVAILNHFANTNRSQVKNFFIGGQLDSEAMESATQNWDRIIALYNQQIQKSDTSARRWENTIKDIYDSPSWRITKVPRFAKRVLKKLAKRNPEN